MLGLDSAVYQRWYTAEEPGIQAPYKARRSARRAARISLKHSYRICIVRGR